MQHLIYRTKSETLVNIYSLVEQNMKSCNAKRRRQRKRGPKKISRSNYKKKTTTSRALFLHISFCRCFARIQRETSKNFLVPRVMEEILGTLRSEDGYGRENVAEKVNSYSLNLHRDYSNSLAFSNVGEPS